MVWQWSKEWALSVCVVTNLHRACIAQADEELKEWFPAIRIQAMLELPSQRENTAGIAFSTYMAGGIEQQFGVLWLADVWRTLRHGLVELWEVQPGFSPDRDRAFRHQNGSKRLA